ncbi:MAG TPA: GAF domain-containing protein [Ktedonobacteraceae bacterium]|nr:GAF domain-containing protein [Ktedonobacteraceae bacterium]
MHNHPRHSTQLKEHESTTETWRTVLQRVIAASGERQRLAAAMSVSPMTLLRWAGNEATPARPQLIHLLQCVQPQYRTELLEALEQDYDDASSWLHDQIPEYIPSQFFSQVLNTRATVNASLRFWQISEMVLKQALAQLDVHGQGMSITLAQCMPPSSGGKIRSLRERLGKGTRPWPEDLQHLAVFLGIESLAGYVVQSRRPASIEDLSKEHLLPAYQTEFEVSAAAYPIWQEGYIAGCLLASSTQVGHFTEQRLSLLGAFSDIISLAFNKEDFYDPDLIALRAMPLAPEQRSHLSSFRQKVSQTIIRASQNHQHIDNFEAERIVWQELEAEFLSLPDQSI